MENELNEQETAALQQALTEHEEQKRRRRRMEPKPRTRIVVPKDEYKRRLVDEMRRDEQDARTNREQRLSAHMKQWNTKVGERFRAATTTDSRVLQRIELLKHGQTHNTSMVLAGDLGVGKTWLAYAYLNACVKEGIFNPAQIVASTESSVLGRIASSGYKRAELFDELKNPLHKIFFIDDVGQAHFSHETGRHEVWYELIDHIYTNDLTLIMTTNRSFTVTSDGKLGNRQLLTNWLGAAAYDRMKHIMGSTGLIIPSGDNKRPAVFQEREQRTMQKTRKDNSQ